MEDVQLERAVVALGAGGVVVLPTDTVYGVAALPGGEDRLAALKGRPADMPIAVLVASEEQARGLAAEPWPQEAARLVSRFWPGPLTMVVPALGGGTVGVRWPDHPFVTALADRVGPIATTSANHHGSPTPATAAEAAAALEGPVDLVVDGGRLEGLASTVVDLVGPEVTVLRAGAISPEALFGEG